MKLLRKAFFLAVGYLTLLSGCATSGSTIGPVSMAPFRLSNAYIQWIDNPSMPFKVQQVTYGGAPPALTESAREISRGYMRSISSVFNQYAVDDMQSALSVKGITPGQAQTITLTQVDGVYGGAEVFAVIRVNIFDNATRQSWNGFVKVTSGVLVSGPNNNPPTREFSKSLTSGAISAFQQAGLMKN